MSDRLYSNEFISWVKATLGLQITKEGLCIVIEEKMSEFVKMLNDQEDHLRTSFLPKKILTAGRVKYQNASSNEKEWKFQSRCTRCCNMFTNILENHNKPDSSINWQCHHPSEQASAPVWWIIAKIFMPGNNISCMRPQEADPLALFGLIKNCKIFSTISTDIKAVIAVRKTLIHLSSNTLTEQEMKDAMNKMKTLLRQEMVKETSTTALNKIMTLERTPRFLTKLSKENRKLVVQALKLKASSIEYEIKQQLSSRMSTKDLEEELQKTQVKIVEENDFYVDEIERVDTTNANSQELYKNESARRQQLEKENVKLHRKLSDADEQVQRKINETEALTEEIKQLKRIRDLYNDESAKRQQLEKENVKLHRKLSDVDEQEQRKIKALTEEIKQLKRIRDLECAKRQQLEQDNEQLRKELSDEKDKLSQEKTKVKHYRKMMEKTREDMNKTLAASFRHVTVKNEVSGAKSGGTFG